MRGQLLDRRPQSGHVGPPNRRLLDHAAVLDEFERGDRGDVLVGAAPQDPLAVDVDLEKGDAPRVARRGHLL